MKKRESSSSSFNLPVLLSFNELGWIAVFGLALFWASAVNSIPKSSSDHENLGAGKDNLIELTNRAALAEQLIQETNRLGQLLSQARLKIEDLNRQLTTIQSSNLILSAQLAEVLSRAAGFSNRMEALRQENERQAGLIVAKDDQLIQQAKDLAAQQLRITQLEADLALATVGLAKLRNDAARPTSEGEVRQEILSLKGGLPNHGISNVVILLDRSGSMDIGGRWKDAISVVETWLTHLPIRNCALVTFNNTCESFPGAGRWLDLSGSNGAQNRRSLVNELRGLKPDGGTDTQQAIETAYSYPNVDTIILFTDGKPQLVESEGSTATAKGAQLLFERKPAPKNMTEPILDFCKNHVPRVPINTVAIGNYFNVDLAGFLLKLSQETGGTFIGR